MAINISTYFDGTWELDEIAFTVPTYTVSGLVAQDLFTTYNYGTITPIFRIRNANTTLSWDETQSDVVGTSDDLQTGDYRWHDDYMPSSTTDKTYQWDLEVWWTGSRYLKDDDTFDIHIMLAHDVYGVHDSGPDGQSAFIFSNNKGSFKVTDGLRRGDRRLFGMFSAGGVSQGQGITTAQAPNTNTYASELFANHYAGSRPVAYWWFKPRVKVDLTPSYPGSYPLNPPGPFNSVPECGGTWPIGETYRRRYRKPSTDPTGGTGTAPGPPTTNTAVSILSCDDCGTCKVSSKPYISGTVDGFGVPTNIVNCNTTVYSASANTCAALLYIYAPIKQENYRICQILFWAGIDTNGKLVSLSDPRYNDIINDISGNDNILSLPVSIQPPDPEGQVNQFNTYQIHPLKVFRTADDIRNVKEEIRTPSGTHEEEMRMWYLKDSVGDMEFNPVTQKFQNVNLTSHQFTTLSRTLTAANYDQIDHSMLYCPTDGLRPYKPLELADGSQVIGWQNQGSGYTPDSSICYEVEWHTLASTLTGFSEQNPIIGGLNSYPIYHTTTNTRSITSRYVTFYDGQGTISLSNKMGRPRKRLPVAAGTVALDHRDHQARAQGLYNDNVSNLSWKDAGYKFSSSVLAVSGRMYNITKHSYPGTTVASVTANRMLAEFNSSQWDIADFTTFTSLSTQEFGLFLHATNKLSLLSPLTADYAALELIGFCTYNGSLTAADGNYYCAAIARGNIPTWVESVTGIGTASPGFENFVVCTSGCNLVLPYIAYRDA